MLGNSRIEYSGSNVHKTVSCNNLCEYCIFGLKRFDQHVYGDDPLSMIQEFLIPCSEEIVVGSYQEGNPVELNEINEGTVETYSISCLCGSP